MMKHGGECNRGTGDSPPPPFIVWIKFFNCVDYFYNIPLNLHFILNRYAYKQ